MASRPNDGATIDPEVGKLAWPTGPIPHGNQDGPSGASHCAGRDSELAQLAELHRSTATRETRLALLIGESGIGKAQILGEYRRRVRLDGGAVLEGRCEPGHAFGPFVAIVDAALSFLAELGRRPQADLGGLACGAGCHDLWHQHRDVTLESKPSMSSSAGSCPAETPRADDNVATEKRLGFFDAIVALLGEVAAYRTPLLLLHDLDRADRGTLELIHHMLEAGTGPASPSAAPTPTCLVVASASSAAGTDEALPTPRGASNAGDRPATQRGDLRVGDGRATFAALVHHPSAVLLQVAALDSDGVRAYLQSEQTVARVLERTGGHPEAIELLLAADPLTPEARLERDLASISSAPRALLEALSVVERPSDLEQLAHVSGTGIDARVAGELNAAGFLDRRIDGGRVLFAFSRIRDRQQIYDNLPADRRAQLHRSAMDVLRQVPGGDRDAALHAVRAGCLEDATRLGMEASIGLSARHAHAEAAALLETVLGACAGDRSVRATIAEDVRPYLCDLHRIAGDYQRALHHARVLAAEAPTLSAPAERLGELLTLAGKLDEAAVALFRARGNAKAQGDQRAVVRTDTLLAELAYQKADYDAALRRAQRALGSGHAHTEYRLQISARNTLGKVALAQKEPRVAAELFGKNRDLAAREGLGHPQAQALTNLGVAMLQSGALPEAEEVFAEAIDVAARVSDTRDRAIATENLAVLAHLRRDYGTARSRYHEAVALLKRLGNRAMLARAANNLGELYLSLGEVQRADFMARFAAQVGGSDLPPSVAGEGLLLRGRVHLARGSLELARESFAGAQALFAQMAHLRAGDAIIELARVALEAGEVGRAREMLGSLPSQDAPKRGAEVALLLAAVERAAGGDPRGHLRRATTFADQADDDELRLPTQLRLSRALADHDDIQGAARALAAAQNAEARLTERVPEEALSSWHHRPLRQELLAVEASLKARGGETVHAAGSVTSISSLPPPPSGSADPRVELWRHRYPDLVGDAPSIRAVLAMIDKAAPSDALVLLRGESGTGKELVAEALHTHSPRHNKPFVKVNCAALVETLLLSELFGHERGAFTGAQGRRKGRFELADSGTIFLDEIGDISPKTQVALLRVLQQREFERVGGTQPIRVDVRIIAATHRDLEQMVRDGTFREDLYYRLRGITIEIPALRRRSEDIGRIAERLLGRIAEERGDARKMLSERAVALLSRHRWPGNVRELENVLRSASLFADAEILDVHDFAAFAEVFELTDPDPETSVTSAPGSGSGSDEPGRSLESLAYREVRDGTASLFELKKALERECIVRALDETDGNITQAAALLGMKRPRLSQLVKQYGLNRSTQGQA